MKAYRLLEWQKPPELVDIEVPEPGPGQVLVRVGGSGACHSDIHLMKWPGGMLPWALPFTLGHEPAGWVEAVGPGVEGLEIGEPVAVYGSWGCGRCAMCRQGLETLCEAVPWMGNGGAGLGHDGGMAEYILVPSSRFVIPLYELDPHEAAPLGDAALTPYRAIKRHLHLLVPGSAAVVIGVGGLGHLAVQILHALTPAKVVAVDISERKLEVARSLGVHSAVTPQHAYEAVQEATGGKGAEVVLDIVGSNESMALGVRLLRKLGAFALVGLAMGSVTLNFMAVPTEASFTTCYWGSLPEFVEVIELARAGKIRVHVEKFSLDDVAQAYERLEKGEIEGRAVIVP
jgi:propanol-preferring alcohol dehydrogenase